jgi:hypothetical protein
VTVLIEHLCASPGHQLPEDAAIPVIPHAGRLGYCPTGATEGHDWRATGGKTLATVCEWLGRPAERNSEAGPLETAVRATYENACGRG